MKKLITLIALLVSFTCNAQFAPDTIPQYDFFILNSDTNSFRVNERVIYNALVKYDNLQGEYWSSKMQDTVTNLIACEVPSAIRIMKIPEITPILPYLAQCIADPSTLEANKSIMIGLDIPNEWKDIISEIYIVNRKQLKIID